MANPLEFLQQYIQSAQQDNTNVNYLTQLQNAVPAQSSAMSATRTTKETPISNQPMIEYFNQEFKNPFKKEIQKLVFSGKIQPIEGLQKILNMQTMDYLKSKKDTTNVLFDNLKKLGY
jgi:L-2-hydroxyglutarate oxidase LhgO